MTQKLGEGGFGVVYRGRDCKLNREVVIKVPHAHLLGSPGFVARFAREIRSLVELDHPRICPILDADEHQGVPYAVVKYLAGGSLQDRRPKDRERQPIPVPLDQVLAWMTPVAEALDFVHEQRYVHRDVKPANILFDAHGNVYLSDFGIAKALGKDPAEGQGEGLTQAGQWIGTPAYIAHEVFLGQAHDERADRYAFGVVMYELLAGRRPFDGTGTAIAVAQASRAAPELREVMPGISEAVSQVFRRILSKQPSDRPVSCVEVVRALSGSPSVPRWPTVRETLRGAAAAGASKPAVKVAQRREPGPPPSQTVQRPLIEVITNSIGMKLVSIRAGKFMMGSLQTDELAGEEEKPQHFVRITRPFYLGVCPVTQARYEQVMGTNPSYFKGDVNCPVETVSWQDAQDFVKRLSSHTEESKAGHVYRLPTEAEWEFACRAAGTTNWCCGDDEHRLGDFAWFRNNSGNQTHPVGQKQPNAWGLYDMHGNVWEWCQDWFDAGYYAKPPEEDPGGPPEGSNHVFRGGSRNAAARHCRSACRAIVVPGHGHGNVGFRVAMTARD